MIGKGDVFAMVNVNAIQADKEQAINSMRRFLTDDTRRVFLLRGSTDSLKIKAALICLAATYKHGVIRTCDMRLVSERINNAFGKELLPSAIRSTAEYMIGGLMLYISRYDGRTKRNPVGNQSTFTLYLLAPDALNDSKRYKQFEEELSTTKSKKVLIITTDDRNVRNWDVTRFVDTFHTYGIRRPPVRTS